MKRESTNRMDPSLDLLVAGAGIAGLYVATRYLKKHPTHSVMVIERNSYLGGRIYTHHQAIPGKGRYQWEAGAGRIPTSHKKVIGLIKEYGLTFQPWKAPDNLVDAPARMAGPTSAITSPKDPFPDWIPIFLEPLLALPASVLAQNTLATLLYRIHGREADRFMLLFPYWSEFHTLRADVALEAFLEGPLGNKHQGWGGCAEGLSALVERMGDSLVAAGVIIQLGVSVLEVRSDNSVRVKDNTGKDKTEKWIHAKKVVLALNADGLRTVKGMVCPALKYVVSEPLMRVYAVFPVVGGKSWFSGMAKVVVPGPIRFFIPMQADRGLAMISYTEGRDVEHWLSVGSEKQRVAAMMAELRQLFGQEIPDPLFVKFHLWQQGCTYWLPGKYDVKRVSMESVQPHKDQEVYVCSESFAMQQSWMESGLVQAEQVLIQMGIH